MKINLLYGQNGLQIDLPEDINPTIIRKHAMTPLPDPPRALQDALENPVEGPPFSQLCRGRRNACILICDITRPVPNGVLLPPLVDALISGGISRRTS